MRLTKLTISGFKSFARTTTFEFPVAVSAIVGPNGSGKSNVAEAIRWVLGEQSIKTLRGRKGEDLIFNGSASSPRMGKASVTLVFNNRDRAIAVDFDEVKVERKIFRDGTNEYYINDSQVRLKDIVEMIARMGLGEAKHNIISQGEVDRILTASPSERKNLLEETIGLRLLQLKKRESERKLEETQENIRQVESLLREIKPHLKFLKTQSDRAQKRELVHQELEDHLQVYIAKEEKEIAEAAAKIAKDTRPAELKLHDLEREISELGRGISSSGDKGHNPNSLPAEEQKLKDLEIKRSELERELGRIEGRLESKAEQAKDQPGTAAVNIDVSFLKSEMTKISGALSAALAESDTKYIREKINQALACVETLAARLKIPKPASKKGENEEHSNLELQREGIQLELKKIDSLLAGLRETLNSEIKKMQQAQASFHSRWQKLRNLEEEASRERALLQRAQFEKEKLTAKRRELSRLIEESSAAKSQEESEKSPLWALTTDELRKKTEKLKIRLEEIGGIDQDVLREYDETQKRFEFLERELGDLAKADHDLRGLIVELEKRIETDFKHGFAKIKEEFNRYFEIIFGGGKGEITYAPIKKVRIDSGTEEEEEKEYGIDINVSLPYKRIKGLAMLSGGERTLVSIALLFAITAVNPPPFLILDETDAALDEANSQKYAATLSELSKKSQLVLITHNRETMKQAGVLYGVTMSDDGISKIFSLKLEEAASYGNR